MLRIIIWLILLLGGSYLLTMKLLPWTYVRVARRFGLRAKLTPITARRIARFKTIKRGYWAFVAISTLFVLSLFLEVVVNDKPLIMSYKDRTAFPAVIAWVDKAVFFTSIPAFYKASEFGQDGDGQVDFNEFWLAADHPGQLESQWQSEEDDLAAERAEFLTENPVPGPDATEAQRERHARRLARLDKRVSDIAANRARLAEFRSNDPWVLMPLHPRSPSQIRTDLDRALNGPSMSLGIPLGTDVSGRDILALMAYGFRISLSFALLVAAAGYSVGVVVGGMQGYYGGWIDIVSQRIVEIWGSVPFLFVMMILAATITPTFIVMVVMLVVLRSWLGITYYVRGEFLREKSKDYVQAAIGAGVSDLKIIVKHILPNAIVPVVTFAPFAIVGYIFALVSLDYLGFGLPPGTPSWGAVLRMGLENVKFFPHLILVPVAALSMTLYSVVMIGEAVREAFDPKVFSRLR